MENYYETLGLKSSASADEIRRAYRILARRYHPDLNPNHKSSEDKFKKISAAYNVLSDPEQKRIYDAELERQSQSFFNAHKAYQRAQRAHENFRKSEERRRKNTQHDGTFINQRRSVPKYSSYGNFFSTLSLPRSISWITSPLNLLKTLTKSSDTQSSSNSMKKVSVVEVSLNIKDSFYGAKKAIEVREPEGTRKISVTIPPGIKNGSVIHMKNKNSNDEELILVIRIPAHPFLSIQTRGLVIEIPVTLNEAVMGASIQVPTLDEPIQIRIPTGTQTGDEIRVQEKGLYLKDGKRGDLFVRVLIHSPGVPLDTIGYKNKVEEFNQYYSDSIRSTLPQSLSMV